MSTHRIVSVETGHPRGAKHNIIVAVNTMGMSEPDEDARWTLTAVLNAMNKAERFYTEAANGRRARVQRYTCGPCGGKEHIRTHVSDQAIHSIQNLAAR